MNTDQVYAMFEAAGYVKRAAFSSLAGIGDGSNIRAKAIKAGVRVVSFRMGDGIERSMFNHADACKMKPSIAQEKKEEPLPLIKFGEQEEEMRKEFEAFRQWKKNQANA